MKGKMGVVISFFKNYFIFFWLHHVACRILVPQPGIKPMPLAVEVESSPLDCQGSPWSSDILISCDNGMIQKIHPKCLVCRKCDDDYLGEIHLASHTRGKMLMWLWSDCGRGEHTKLNGIVNGLTPWPFLVSTARRKDLAVSRCLVRQPTLRPPALLFLLKSEGTEALKARPKCCSVSARNLLKVMTFKQAVSIPRQVLLPQCVCVQKAPPSMTLLLTA